MVSGGRRTASGLLSLRWMRHIYPYTVSYIRDKNMTGEHAQEDHLYPFAGHAKMPNTTGGYQCRRWRSGVDGARGRPGHISGTGAVVAGRHPGRSGRKPCPDCSCRCSAVTRITGQMPGAVERNQCTVWINLIQCSNHYMTVVLSGHQNVPGLCTFICMTMAGKLIHPLTSGPWMVDAIVGVDEDRNLVYFMGTYDSVLERHLYAVPLSGGLPRRSDLRVRIS